MSPGQQAHQQVLGVVGVLVLVHHDVAKSFAVLFQHIGELLKQLHCQQNNVVEVHRRGGPELILVFLVDLGGGFVQVVIPHLLFHLGGGEELILGLGDNPQHRLGGKLLFVQTEFTEALLEHPHAVVGIVDGEAAPIPQGGDFAAEDAHTGGVEGGGIYIPALLPQKGLEALPQLPGGLVGKGDG